MGKYDEVIGKLAKTLTTEPKYQDQVNLRKQEIQKARGFKQWAGKIAELYAKARFARDEVNAELYDLNLTLTALEQMLADQFEVEGTTSLKLDSGFGVRVQVEPYAQVQDRETFREWCLKNGYEAKMALPPATTTALVKELLLNGEDIPPGIGVYAKNKIVFTR